MKEFLDPKRDLTFKRVFGTESNKEVLLAFLNAVFEGVHPKVEEVTFLPTHQCPKTVTLAQSFVDVSCRDEKGNRFIIEMQCYSNVGFLERACYYASQAYVNQKKPGKKSKYSDLEPVIFLAIVEKLLFPNSTEYISHDKLLNIRTYECRMEQFSFSFLELAKINKTLEEPKNIIEKWAYFLKSAPETTEEEMKEITQDYPELGLAYEALDRCNYTPEEIEEYERLAMNADSIAAGLEDAEKRGLAEGKAETTREMVIGMARKGIDKSVIAEISQLSLEEIEQMLK